MSVNVQSMLCYTPYVYISCRISTYLCALLRWITHNMQSDSNQGAYDQLQSEVAIAKTGIPPNMQ